METFYRPTWVEVSMDALRHNIGAFRQALPAGMGLMAVVKADAYGHGAVKVAREAIDCGAAYIGVAFLDEGLELRRAGVRAPILVLGYTPPEGLPIAIKEDITLTVFQDELWAALERQTDPSKLKVHVKIDTGMGRLGLQANEEAIAFLERALRHPLLDVEGVYTHFACADEADKSYTLEQHEKFERVVGSFRERGVSFRYLHTGNSATGIDCPNLSYNMVRLGISMYGMYPSEQVNKERVELRPVMSLKTKMAHIKTLPPGAGISYGVIYRTKGEETIATLPIGYADGYSRILSEKVHALVRGKRVPIVGRICMDQCMANVSTIDNPTKEEEVVLLGAQGSEVVTAEELASLLGTVNYEVTCMISHRVPRIYIRNGQRIDVANPLLR
ncbi:alanine racemase [Paenibacillus flagellatus]|uniref:Alanine racemase n=1 Tax=Paenibacillus flagellatus TaxID=2211139 RepID=A0A2V5K4W3_9BACL|nr:alanine racemase [Paenibacillus flagellatus]PYI52944.1 alanine racemase [Paenibacillus flagellatus]